VNDKEKDQKVNLKPESKVEPAVKPLPAADSVKKVNTDKKEKN
jgi:hypothetical protein